MKLTLRHRALLPTLGYGIQDLMKDHVSHSVFTSISDICQTGALNFSSLMGG